MSKPPARIRAVDLDDLVTRTRDRDPHAVARLISLVEHESPRLRDVAAALAPACGRARVVGLTGSPGVGKSTTMNAVVTRLRAEGRRVGVLAVDPSSPFSGGALLGDRIRMQDHAEDDGVFIRSMASRGQLGGLSAAVPQAVRVLDAAGYDVILVETVGVGQAELEIASLADSTVLVLAPGMGDGVQAAKAGVIEIADVFVVNKADREGAADVARDLRSVQSLVHRSGDGERWRAPIVRTTAVDGTGVADLVSALDAHHEWLVERGELVRRRRTRAAAEIEAIALGTVRARFAKLRESPELMTAAREVASGADDPYRAADDLVATLRDT